MNCVKCNHEHSSDALGNICVGCPCPERPKEQPSCLVCNKKAARYCSACAVDVALDWYDDEPARDEERDDVIAFMKQCIVDHERCGTTQTLEALIRALEAEEHRR